jgi:hypothetical protein
LLKPELWKWIGGQTNEDRPISGVANSSQVTAMCKCLGKAKQLGQDHLEKWMGQVHSKTVVVGDLYSLYELSRSSLHWDGLCPQKHRTESCPFTLWQMSQYVKINCLTVPSMAFVLVSHRAWTQ